MITRREIVQTSVQHQLLRVIMVQVLKRRAEEFLDAVVDTAVITVPSHFSMQQRLATMNAATMAGLGRVSLLQVWLVSS